MKQKLEMFSIKVVKVKFRQTLIGTCYYKFLFIYFSYFIHI